MWSVGIVGATGAVGTEMLSVLERRNFPVSKLRLFASSSSAGKTLSFRGQPIEVEAVSETSFADLDFVLFSAGSGISKAWREAATRAGCVMIDNSSAFRMDDDVPLVVPEINGDDLSATTKVIAVPNCSAIVMLMAVAPLRALGKIHRIVVSTYQAVSGAGAKAMQELEDQTRAYVQGEPLQKQVLPHQIAFNLFCHNAAVTDNGYNGEEWKIITESRKILHDPDLRITATCVRVPVLRAHSESVNIEFESKRPSVDDVRAALAAYPGVRVIDDRANNHFPMPIEAAGTFDIYVGHIREDVSNDRAIDLFVSGDQLLKGAALDAVQIAETMIAKGYVRPKTAAVAL
jgi:aspartate-semialdehyde dehydrogenase